VLGVSVALSEAEVHWRAFLDGLIARGLRGVKLIVSDNYRGLKAARLALFAGFPWQRCQFHLQQNAQSYVQKIQHCVPIARQIRQLFNAPDVNEAQRLHQQPLEEEIKRRTRIATLFPYTDSCLRLVSAILAEQDEEWLNAKI
jgi:putative transposase